MRYNLLPGALWAVNLTEGTTDISFDKLNKLVEYGDIPVVELCQDDLLVLDFDLGTRISLDKVYYKFETSHATSTAVASGIGFSYKNESFETVYTSLAICITEEPNVYAAGVSGTVWAPRYLRVEHDVAATYGVTTVSGFLYGIQATNDDTKVNFGDDGNLELATIEAARGGVADVRTIPIYNNGSNTADAFINIEPSYTELDGAIAVSSSPDGPWTSPLDASTVVFNNENYDLGTFYRTDASYGNLRITGWEDGYENYTSRYSYGTYLTRLFYKGVEDQMVFEIDRYLPQKGRLVVDKDDATETIEVRFSNTPPKDYSCLREIYSWYTSYTYYYAFRDRWSETFAIKESSSSSFMSTTRYTSLQNYQVVQDFDTERWAGWLTTYGTSSGYSVAKLYIFNNKGTTYKTKQLSFQSTSKEPVNCSWREIKLNMSGGIWVYFFCQGYHSGDFASKTGYFLAYFDTNLSEQFKWYTENEQIKDLDVDYTYGYVWYTRPESNAIYKVSTTGDTLVQYIEASDGITNNLGGIAVLDDAQGVWFGNNKDLHKLHSDGYLLPEFTIEGAVSDYIKYIAIDGNGSETLWVIDGFTVGLLFVAGEKKGIYDFRVTLPYPVRLESTPTGCWVYCVDLNVTGKTHMRFISKENRREESSYSPSGTSRPGPIELTYKHSSYSDKMPINTDTHWSSLPWNKVAVQGFLSPEAMYYQAKITFRRQELVERYDFVTDPEQDYYTTDTFDQTSPIPNQVLWENWKDKYIDDGLNRVRVDPTAGVLQLDPDWGGISNAWIRTKNRVVTAKNSSNKMEVRVSYIFGDGNTGSASGRSEYLYIYGYSVDEGKLGNSIAASIYIPTNIVGNHVLARGKISTYSSSWSTTSLGSSQYDYYQGTLRLYCQSDDRLYFYVAKGTSTTFNGGGYVSNWTNNGSRWYWQISGDKNSSPLVITKFEVRQGNNHYYTDSPRVGAMHTQHLVQVNDIYPQSHKNAYLRTQVQSGSELDAYNEADLKVRWRTPVY